jgi:hypothetical protein
MKPFQTIVELMDQYKHTKSQFLTTLCNSKEDEAYIYLNAGDPRMLQSAFLPLPKNLIQELLILESSNTFLDLELHIFHTLYVNNINDVLFIVSLEEVSSKEPSKLSFKYNSELSYYLIAHPGIDYDSNLLTRWDNLDPINCMTSKTKISIQNIYIRSDSKLVEDLKSSVGHLSLEYLSPMDYKSVVDLLNVVGIKRIKNLSSILDPNWPFYSTELNLAIELQEQILIESTGNKNHTPKNQMVQYLNKKYPIINPLPFPLDKGKKLNELTDRLCTMANPDKEKDHLLKKIIPHLREPIEIT